MTTGHLLSLTSRQDSPPKYNIIQLIFRNLLCQFPGHTHQSEPGFSPSSIDDYFHRVWPSQYNPRPWDPSLFPEENFQKVRAWLWGPTTGVSLRCTGFSFLCGNGVYLDLPTLWKGSCTIIAVVPEVTIMTTKDLASSVGIPNLGSFLKEALRPVWERQK